MITTGLSPNVQADDVRLAAKLLFQPWQWLNGNAQPKLTAALQTELDTKHVWLFQSGRSGLLSLLRSLELPAGSEVLLQAFTCNAVANPILWAGFTPVYVDIEADTLNMNPALVASKITLQTKVLIIQHTFGNPAKLAELLAVAKQHHLIVIEDCAHALGGMYQGKPLGSFGDAALFSFGRDKVISSVFGGAIAINNPTLIPGVERIVATLPYPSRLFVVQQLLHPILTTLSKALWDIQLGKVLFTVSQKLKLLSLAVSKAERLGQHPAIFPTKLPNALAALALHQWSKLAEFNQHRQRAAKAYQQQLTQPAIWIEESIYLRYTIQVPNAVQLMEQAKLHSIYLGDWYTSVLAPNTASELKQFGYITGSCPVAERVASQVVNLPTHIGITNAQIKQISDLVNHA